MKKEPIVVYWTPVWDKIDDPEVRNWNLLYKDPTTLHEEYATIRNKKFPRGYFMCPAVTSGFKNTLVFRSPMTFGYTYSVNESGNIIFVPKTSNYLSIVQERPPTLTSAPTITLSYRVALFSEEPLVAHFTSPYFHKSGYTSTASLIPGSFDVGQWFRPFNMEMQLWETEGELNFKDNEPLLYVDLQTDRPIILKRFTNTSLLNKLIFEAANDSLTIESQVPLINRYKRFKETRQRSIVMREIKNNLLD